MHTGKTTPGPSRVAYDAERRRRRKRRRWRPGGFDKGIGGVAQLPAMLLMLMMRCVYMKNSAGLSAKGLPVSFLECVWVWVGRGARRRFVKKGVYEDARQGSVGPNTMPPSSTTVSPRSITPTLPTVPSSFSSSSYLCLPEPRPSSSLPRDLPPSPPPHGIHPPPAPPSPRPPRCSFPPHPPSWPHLP